MSKQLVEYQQGVKYPGYGILNEFGEFTFIPQETGSRKEQKKCLVEDKEYTVYYTKNKIILHCTMPRTLSRNERIRKVLNLLDNFIKVLQNYDF